MMKNSKNSEKLNIASVEPFPKIRYAELPIYLAAVVLGIIYLSKPDAIPTPVMLIVFAVCLVAAVVIRAIWIGQTKTKKLSAVIMTVLLGICAVMVAAVTVMYFTAKA